MQTQKNKEKWGWLKSLIRVFVLIVIATISFFCGAFWVMKDLEADRSARAANLRAGEAIYELLIYARMLDNLELGRKEEVKKAIVAEFRINIPHANRGNAIFDAMHNVSKHEVQLVCAKAIELGLQDKIIYCNSVIEKLKDTN